MNLLFETPLGVRATRNDACPRLVGNTLTLGTLVIISCLSVLLLVVNSSVNVDLFALTVTAVFGLFAVRGRAVQGVAHVAIVEEFADTVVLETVFTDGMQAVRRQRLQRVGSQLLERSRAHNKPLTVALFDFSDLPELQTIFAGEVAKDLGPTIARMLKRITPRKGVVVRMGPTAFIVLLPNFDAARTRAAIESNFGRACCLEFAVGDHEMLLVPDFLVETVRRDTSSVEDVYRILCSDLVRGQRHEERRQMHLRVERESHTSRGAPLCPIDGTEI